MHAVSPQSASQRNSTKRQSEEAGELQELGASYLFGFVAYDISDSKIEMETLERSSVEQTPDRKSQPASRCACSYRCGLANFEFKPIVKPYGSGLAKLACSLLFINNSDDSRVHIPRCASNVAQSKLERKTTLDDPGIHVLFRNSRQHAVKGNQFPQPCQRSA